MNKLKKPTVSVGISAYNEQNNICAILRGILLQHEESFEIREIIVISDGSRDKTVEYARQMVSNKVKVIDGKTRLGKPARLNEIFTIFKGDILVLLDADVMLSSEKVLASLVRPIIKDCDVALVNGVAIPQAGRTLVEKAVNLSVDTYLKYADRIRRGKTIYAVEGRIMGLSKKFAKSLHIPENIVGTDAYLYFSAISQGLGFAYVKSASVAFRSPSTIVEQYRQNLRFVASQHKMKAFFGKLADREYQGKRLLLYQLMLGQFVRKPLQSLLIFMVNFYCKVRAAALAKRINAIWDIAGSTKGRLNA